MDDISLYIDYIIVSSFCTPVSSFSLPLQEEFLKEIEPLIFDREEMKTPIETDQNGKVIKYMTATKVTNRIVSSINKDLTGKYYKLMYGKKAEKQM